MTPLQNTRLAMHRLDRLAVVIMLCLLLCGSPLPAKTPPHDPQAGAHRARAAELKANFDYLGAIAEYQQAYVLDKSAHLEDAIPDLYGIGICYVSISQYPKALEFFQQELTLERQIGDQEDEASSLNNIGLIYDDLSQYARALDFYQQALTLVHQIGDKAGEATTLNNIGEIYRELSQYGKALDFYGQALPIERQVGDRTGEATTLVNIGAAYDSQSQYAEALDYYGQGLTILRQVGDKAGEATTLNNIGNVEISLSQYAKALEYFQQALTIRRQVGDKEGEEITLGNIGAAYRDLSQYDKSLDFYQQALPTCRQIGDKVGEAMTLNNIGNVYIDQSQYPEALAYLQQALTIHQQIEDKAGEATTLNGIGSVYTFESQYDRALDYLQQALLVRRQAGDKSGEAVTLNNIMLVWNLLGKPGLAIWYGKQAVNAYQGIRAGITALDKESQTRYLETNASTYRDLADLLIAQGRLPEAQQILRLLKEQEFFDFVHADAAPSSAPPDTAALTRREARSARTYEAAAAPLAALGKKQQALRQKKTLSPAEQKQMAALDAQAQSAKAHVTAALAQIATDFAGPRTEDDAPPRTAGAQDVGKALTPGTVAVYTIVAPDTLHLIVVTPAEGGRPSRTVARSFPVKAGDLYKKVYAFRQALTHPALDPRPLGAELYRMVFGPIQKDLDVAHAATILFSLDDALRYVPAATLYDDNARKYVAEQYRTALITLAGSGDRSALAAPSVAPSVLGMGVSESLGGAPALPGVTREMAAIVRQGRNEGVFSGASLMDARFTQASMTAALAPQRYPLVHIASHFALYPTDAASYLLLGDGSQMTVAAMKQNPHLFAGVSLLTLSACDTAMEIKNSSGKEVEGFGALAQQLGAHSVVASLWPVSDAATPAWMQAFYDFQRQHPTAPLSEALRQAQLAMLGRAAPLPEPGRTQRAGRAVEDEGDTSALPLFKTDPAHPFAHPYYWAPFVLIGNWR